jgi:dienelactone hydrolase
MKKFLKISGLFIFGVLIVAGIIFAVWVKIVYKAEPEKLKTATDEISNDYRITEKPDYWEIIPNIPEAKSAKYQDAALIFYPGAKVEPNAYFYKLSVLSNGQVGRIKVFVTKPPLNLAMFGINQAGQIIKEHPEVKKWILGGHSLGGSMSCEYAKNHAEQISELWMFASYCGSDISQTKIKAVTIHGSLDSVINPSEISENRKNLPPDNTEIKIEGMNHSQFGNYAEQSGDTPPTKSDEDIRRELINLFGKLFSQ